MHLRAGRSDVVDQRGDPGHFRGRHRRRSGSQGRGQSVWTRSFARLPVVPHSSSVMKGMKGAAGSCTGPAPRPWWRGFRRRRGRRTGAWRIRHTSRRPCPRQRHKARRPHRRSGSPPAPRPPRPACAAVSPMIQRLAVALGLRGPGRSHGLPDPVHLGKAAGVPQLGAKVAVARDALGIQLQHAAQARPSPHWQTAAHRRRIRR
jgi:hypothetical protein